MPDVNDPTLIRDAAAASIADLSRHTPWASKRDRPLFEATWQPTTRAYASEAIHVCEHVALAITIDTNNEREELTSNSQNVRTRARSPAGVDSTPGLVS